jgi:hypothetical protein
MAQTTNKTTLKNYTMKKIFLSAALIAFVSIAASAQNRFDGGRRDIRGDMTDLRKDIRDKREDKFEIRKDLRNHDYRDARMEKRDLRMGKRDIRRDKFDLNRDGVKYPGLRAKRQIYKINRF